MEITDELKFESMNALSECMEKNGLNRNDAHSYILNATIHNMNDKYPKNGTRVTFYTGQHSNFGPSIELDITAKGYGIKELLHKPSYQIFSYEPNTNKLTIEADRCKFSLYSFKLIS